MLTEQQFQQYCQSIGLNAADYKDAQPTLVVLMQFQYAQLKYYPFQSLSTVLHEPILLDDSVIFQKLVEDRRGGYCYELNSLLQSALRYLGFEVDTLSAYIVHDNAPERPKARTHTLLKVVLDNQDYLVDVGFGGLVPTVPLKMEWDTVQQTPHGLYKLTAFADKYVLSAEVKGQWQMLYAFDLSIQNSADLEVGNWFVSTHPHSPFRTRLMVSRIDDEGVRYSLLNTRYHRHQVGKDSQRQDIEGVDSLLTLLQDVFGINTAAVDTPNDREKLQLFLAENKL